MRSSAYFGQIESTPLAFVRVSGRNPTRRALLARFPYSLVFATLDPGEVLVVALAHTKRREGYWRGRLRG
jgi:hypothetical protein